MTSGAEGSSASANAGKMSVIKLSQRICSATSGKGQPIIRAINNGQNLRKVAGCELYADYLGESAVTESTGRTSTVVMLRLAGVSVNL